jgi:hypothetical protein
MMTTLTNQRGVPSHRHETKPAFFEETQAAHAQQRRLALSRMASKMGCKSCGELAMARSTSEVALLLDVCDHPILQLRSGSFGVLHHPQPRGRGVSGAVALGRAFCSSLRRS